MNLADLAGPGSTPACWEKPALFSARALDYDPQGDEYRHLDLIAHTMMSARKDAAEEAAVDVCFGCPLMLACEQIDETNCAEGLYVTGVIGGRTEAERKARRSGRTAATKAASVPNPQIAPGDRGPRNQVDDDLVATLTKAGKTSDQIAHTLGCSPRTVSRARKRMGLGSKQRQHNTMPATAAVADAATVDASPDLDATIIDATAAFAVRAAAETVLRTEQTAARNRTTVRSTRKHTAISTPNQSNPANQANTVDMVNPFIGGRPVSPAMEAVYNHLVAVGGSERLDDLIAVGMPFIDPAEAITSWTKSNSVTQPDGSTVLRPTKAQTPTADRIREGARAKVRNAIDATQRKGRYLNRDGDTYMFKADALSAWTARMNATLMMTSAC